MRHDEHLLPWYNRHAGERTFIVGSGHSLNDVPRHLLYALNNEVTWVVNWATRCTDNILQPTYFACSEAKRLPRMLDEVAKLPSLKAKFYAHREPLHDYVGWTWLPRDNDLTIEAGDFAGLDGPEFEWSANGHSVIYDVCVQLSAYMGFREIYLV